MVELKQSYKNVSISEGKYDTRTEGVVIAIPDDAWVKNRAEHSFCHLVLGKRVHFEEFKEGARIKRDKKIYSFIKIEDIRGYESVEAS